MSCRGYTEQQNNTFCLSLNTLSAASKSFVGFFWQMHWADDFRQQRLQASFLGHDGQFHHQYQRALAWIVFLYMHYPTFIYSKTPMPPVCLLFHFVRSCRTFSLAWHLGALRGLGIFVDLEILCTLLSAGCE